MIEPRVEFRYCTKCKWLLRAAWLSQEILQTFEDEIGEVALVPGEAGEFKISVSGTLIWDRKIDNGFPQPKVLKQRVRDVIAPNKQLGHSDTK